jgi:hypothetical protein
MMLLFYGRLMMAVRKYLKFIFPVISVCNMDVRESGKLQTDGEAGWMKEP